MKLTERTLTPELGVIDIVDDLVWHRDGRLTLGFHLTPFHEPSLGDGDFDRVAQLAEDVFNSGLPEGTRYQFLVAVDLLRGAALIEEALPPIGGAGPRTKALEALRRSRLAELTPASSDPGAGFVQDRRLFFFATFLPVALARRAGGRRGDRLRHLLSRGRSRPVDWATAYEAALAEAKRFRRRVEYGLQQIGLPFRVCGTDELVGVFHELLSPTRAGLPLGALSARARGERWDVPRPLFEALPYMADTSPAWALLEDDVVVRREYLAVGDRFLTVLSVKALPDRTEPGLLLPLLHLSRRRYYVSYGVEIPEAGLEIASLKARARLAAGLKLQNFLVRTDRQDPLAAAVERQADEALAKMIASTQRILGASLHVVLYEDSPEDIEEGVQEVLATMSRAHGLRGVRETYLLKPAFLSTLPGAPSLVERRRRTLSPVAVDLMPLFSFREGKGKVPLLTPTNSVVFYDPFDAEVTANANILVTGTSGSGKSFLVSSLLSGYEIACAAKGEPGPYTFILDNGDSYSRYAEITGGRYVTFTFQEPPGVDIFAWDERASSLDEHVSRLEWLLLDLLRINPADEERFEQVKAAVEEALKEHLYRTDLPRSFQGLREALARTGGAHAEGILKALYPFTEGKFARLFEPNPRLAMSEDVRVMVYDFKGLGEHRDLASVALRLTIYEVRRWAARVCREGHRTFLVLDESWALLDSSTGGAVVAATAAPFLAASVRMGRKEKMSVCALSQQIEDFAASAYGAAIIGNSATFFVGAPGPDAEGLRRHLRLSDRQLDQVRRLRRTSRYHEFLLVRGETSDVVRIPGDALSRWVFTTAPQDRQRIQRLAEERPDLDLLERMSLLAQEE